MRVKNLLLVFCVGISLIQVHGAKKMNEGVAKEKRELESSPYEFNVPQKRYNYQVVNLPNDDYYHGVHEQLSSSNYNQNTAGMNQKPSYYSGQFGEFPVKNQNFGYSGFPQEAAPSFGQFDSLNKFSAAPFSENFNFESFKGNYPTPNFGDLQSYFNSPQSQAFSEYFQHQNSPSFYSSQPHMQIQPLTSSPKPTTKVPNYALGYKGLSHYSPSAPVKHHDGLGSHGTLSSYQQPSIPLVSYSQKHTHPIASYPTTQKPFRVSASYSVSSDNGHHQSYDSYGEQSITNEKPVYSYLPNPYYKEPSKEYIPVTEKTTERQPQTTEYVKPATESPPKSYQHYYVVQNQYVQPTTQKPASQPEKNETQYSHYHYQNQAPQNQPQQFVYQYVPSTTLAPQKPVVRTTTPPVNTYEEDTLYHGQDSYETSQLNQEPAQYSYQQNYGPSTTQANKNDEASVYFSQFTYQKPSKNHHLARTTEAPETREIDSDHSQNYYGRSTTPAPRQNHNSNTHNVKPKLPEHPQFAYQFARPTTLAPEPVEESSVSYAKPSKPKLPQGNPDHSHFSYRFVHPTTPAPVEHSPVQYAKTVAPEQPQQSYNYVKSTTIAPKVNSEDDSVHYVKIAYHTNKPKNTYQNHFVKSTTQPPKTVTLTVDEDSVPYAKIPYHPSPKPHSYQHQYVKSTTQLPKTEEPLPIQYEKKTKFYYQNEYVRSSTQPPKVETTSPVYYTNSSPRPQPQNIPAKPAKPQYSIHYTTQNQENSDSDYETEVKAYYELANDEEQYQPQYIEYDPEDDSSNK